MLQGLLRQAILNGDTEGVKTLIDLGVNVSNSLLYLPTAYCKLSHLEIAGLLIAAGAKPDAVNERGDTILHLITFHPSYDIQSESLPPSRLIDFLGANGSNPNALNQHGLTPLWYAAFRGNLLNVRALLSIKVIEVDLTRDSYKRTPLFAAVETMGTNKSFYEFKFIVVSLLKAGANPKLCLSDGTTIEEVARANGNTDFPTLIQEFSELQAARAAAGNASAASSSALVLAPSAAGGHASASANSNRMTMEDEDNQELSQRPSAPTV